MRKAWRWLGLLLVVACAPNPYTQRNQFLLTSEAQEMSLGAEAFAQIRAEVPPSRDRALQEQLQQVGQRLVRASGRTDYQWEFVVLEDPKNPNAFALPGGKVAVYTGLFPLIASDAELAAVVGHEMAHVLLRHGGERISRGLVTDLIEAGLIRASEQTLPQERLQVIRLAYGVGSTLAVELPFSRQQELESDRLGLLLMADAGYDPRAALDFWSRMAAQSAGLRLPEFLSTHPLDAHRMAYLQQALPEAMARYSRGN